MLPKIFVGLGGNVGEVAQTIQKALKAIEALPGVYDFHSSALYFTTPVEMLNDNCFTNAVCSFYTHLDALTLLEKLQQIERDLGKTPKARNESRAIDLDILFFGEELYQYSNLQVPHPRWRERLFVLVPLLELTKTVRVNGLDIDLIDLINNFKNLHEEVVTKK